MLRITVQVVKDREVVAEVAQVNVANVTNLEEVSDYVAEARVQQVGAMSERLSVRVQGHARRRGALLLCARVLLKLAARMTIDSREAMQLDSVSDKKPLRET